MGAFGTYFTLNWQEEQLEYFITDPAEFGDINYQNITLTNTGWNPAVNIRVYIDHADISFDNIQSSKPLKPLHLGKNLVVGIERVRRDESIVLSLAYTGKSLLGSDVRIVSDRSIAIQSQKEIKTKMPIWATITLWIFGGFFVLGLISSITIPAYQDYVKRAAESKDFNKQE